MRDLSHNETFSIVSPMPYADPYLLPQHDDKEVYSDNFPQGKTQKGQRCSFGRQPSLALPTRHMPVRHLPHKHSTPL
jgi:hypothetical protein